MRGHKTATHFFVYKHGFVIIRYLNFAGFSFVKNSGGECGTKLEPSWLPTPQIPEELVRAILRGTNSIISEFFMSAEVPEPLELKLETKEEERKRLEKSGVEAATEPTETMQETPLSVTPEQAQADAVAAQAREAEDAVKLSEVKERLGMNGDKGEVNTTNSEASKVGKIREYERVNGVNQDVIAQSYLAHVDIYKELSEKVTTAMNRYFLLEKSNTPDNPSVIEAKEEWDNAVAATENEYKIMNPMLEHLTPETLEKYRKDFELREAINPN